MQQRMEINGYRLQEKIGEGGMSQVYRAEQLSLQRTVAIKFLSEELLNHSTAQELFENEPLIVARLSHPKIIQVIDKGVTEDGKPYFVMQYVEGITLHDLVQQEKIPNSRKIDFLIQICRGLSFAHRNSIVHRDIKPANVVIDSENNAKILDFGIASFYTDERFVEKNASRVLGTERYMAPEVKQTSANASILSDLYSLGVLMFEVFSENFIDDVTPQAVNVASIPKPIKPIILQCLSAQPDKRPTSASIIENQLLHVLKGAHLALSQKANAEKDIASLSKNFSLLDVIAENPYGSVYLYEKNQTNDLMVIKKRKPDSSGLKEAKLLANLKHPNIINIHGTASNARAAIIVMEYLDGGSLAERLVQPMAITTFFQQAKQMLSGLAFAHQNRIFHGNLRPTNILYSQQGEVKITDFGCNEHYLSDEQSFNWYHPIKEEPVSHLLDIFAMGALFFHMLTGEPLRWSDQQIEWTKTYAELPKPLREWLIKCLALDPAYRFQSAHEANRALQDIQTLPPAKLTRSDRSDPIGLKRAAKKSFSVLKFVKRVVYVALFALLFTYLQIYFFAPEIKTFLHLELREFLLWWAEQLKP